MTTGLVRVYFKEEGDRKWRFEASFVHVEHAREWVSLQLNCVNPDLNYKMMQNGRNVE